MKRNFSETPSKMVDVKLICMDPRAIRQTLEVDITDQANIELAKSIKESGLFFAPVANEPKDKSLLPEGKQYAIVDGGRRAGAMITINGMTKIPLVIAQDITNDEVLDIQMMANEHRKPNTAKEICDFILRKFAQGLTPEQVAQNICKSVPYVYRYAKLNNLIPELKELAGLPNAPGSILIMLSKLSEEGQMKMVKENDILGKKMTVQKATELIEAEVNNEKAEKKSLGPVYTPPTKKFIGLNTLLEKVAAARASSNVELAEGLLMSIGYDNESLAVHRKAWQDKQDENKNKNLLSEKKKEARKILEDQIKAVNDAVTKKAKELLNNE